MQAHPSVSKWLCRLWCCVYMSLLALMVGAGCKGKQDASPDQVAASTNQAASPPAQTADSAAPPSQGAPAPVPPTPGVVQPSADQQAVLAQLTLEVRKFVVSTRTVPKNFDEFASKSQIQIPAPPSGKKYAIKNQEVVLVDR
jgi:hypothetical protein